jgi:hypothetical protein
MKGGQNLRELQQKQKEKEEEAWIHQPICCICNRKCEGYHGRWGDSGTCDSACEAVQAAKPKYPGHTEKDFLSRNQL